MNKEELVVILRYARLMSRHIAPINLNGHDGSMSDFYFDLYVAAENGHSLNIQNDEFYKNVFDRMKEILDEQ